MSLHHCFIFFFFNDTATTEIYTLSLHDALPICRPGTVPGTAAGAPQWRRAAPRCCPPRSEEHTSELQSQSNLVCRLLLEKKKEHNKGPDNTHEHTTANRDLPADSPNTDNCTLLS